MPTNFNAFKFRFGWATHIPFTSITSRLPHWLLLKGVKNYVGLRLPMLPKKEKEVLTDFAVWFTSLPDATTEEALFILFRRGARAKRGLEIFLSDDDFTTPFSIFYGRIDWMRALNHGLSLEIIKKRNNKMYQHFVIPASNHNMFIENPKAM